MRYAIGLICLSCLVLISCQSAPPANDRFPEAQELVNSTMDMTPNLVRLSIHAVPTGETNCIYVATSAADRIYRASDPEDLKGLNSGARTVMREGENLDVTIPMRNARGRIVAVAGITLANPDQVSEAELVSQADGIAANITRAVANARKPLW